VSPGRLPFIHYLRLTSAAGVVLLASVLGAEGHAIGPLDSEFWVLAGLVLLGELFPIQVHGQEGVETFSTPFAFALLLIYGTPEVLLVQAAASAVADAAHRRPADRVVFNVAQLSLSWAAAGAVLALLGGAPLAHGEPLGAEDLPAMAAAAVVFFVVNSCIVRTAEALLQGVSLSAHQREDLLFRAWSAGVLFAIGPPAAVVAQKWLYLVPLLALPMAAVGRASKQASVMERLAMYDTLTSLPNRSLLRRRGAVELARARAAGRLVAVLLLDVDRFRDVNDTLGRFEGDVLLVEVGRRLVRLSRGTDIVARLGADQFVLVLPEVGDSRDAVGAAGKLLEELSRPLEVAGVTLRVDASVGIACYPEHGGDVDALLQHAEAAMYRAKRAQSRIEVSSPELDEEAPLRLALVTSLKQALEAGLIELRYQPKVRVASGLLVGVEALARWSDRTLGAVPPSTFIPLAERTGLIRPLTDHVLEVALSDWRRWRSVGFDVPIAINVSAPSLHDPDFPASIAAHLERAGVEGGALELEITETTLMGDHAQARSALAELSALGVRIAIDDFGTGYSSLAYLRELHVHALKIDRSFVARMDMESDSEAIVRAIIELARNLGLETVAEGVEDAAVRTRLARLGCDCIQGYLISRPLPTEGLLGWIRSEGALERWG
jgi:diguanylate cyclase (GGDEF)-like protein